MLPVAKLGTLLLKTVAKPIGNRLKKEAALHPCFRQIIVNMAQANHRVSTNMQRRLYGHATDVAIRPLNEEKAIQSATDLIGEVFVFTVAGAVVVFEVQRNARSEARKEEQRKEELEGCIEGYNYVRPFLFIDGTFSRVNIKVFCCRQLGKMEIEGYTH